MGAGKTTVGRRLAEELNMDFVDLDLFIENRYRKKVGDIFAEKGEAGFREIEMKTLQEVAHFENVLISTGGGTPCFFENMSFMNESGITVYIKVTKEELANRLDLCKHNRPLIKDKSKEELLNYIHENLIIREPFYNQATLKVNSGCLNTIEDIDFTVDELITSLRKIENYESKTY